MSVEHALWEHRARRWLNEATLQVGTSLVVFAVVALVSTSQLYVNWVAAGVDVTYSALLAVRSADWLTWSLAVPLVVVVDRSMRRRGRPWPQAFLLHGLTATGWFAFQNLVPVSLRPLADPASADMSFVVAYLSRGLPRLPTALVVYSFILGVVWMLRDFVRRQELARDLYDAQLRALRAQIQPHFLFNTLHTVGALVRVGDRQRAIETLVALSELLRRTLSHSQDDEVPLGDELEFLDVYLAIQKARFGDNLLVSIEVAPPAREARVPQLVLQPLVENAIRHGLDLEEERGTIRIDIGVEDQRWLHVRVEDDGGKLGDAYEGPEDEGGGIGLSNLRERLTRLYGADHTLELGVTEHGTTAVTITMPMRGVGHDG